MAGWHQHCLELYAGVHPVSRWVCVVSSCVWLGCRNPYHRWQLYLHGDWSRDCQGNLPDPTLLLPHRPHLHWRPSPQWCVLTVHGLNAVQTKSLGLCPCIVFWITNYCTEILSTRHSYKLNIILHILCIRLKYVHELAEVVAKQQKLWNSDRKYYQLLCACNCYNRVIRCTGCGNI